MNPLIVTVSLPELDFLCRVGPADASAPGPSRDIPELETLNHYAGVWEDDVLSPSSLKRTEIGEWVLDGAFLRQSWITETAEGLRKASGVTLMTFDKTERVFMSWSFLAIASVVHCRGEWDAGTHTMTWIDHLSRLGELVITTASFSGNVTNEWSIVEQNADGKTIRKVTGKSVRRRV